MRVNEYHQYGEKAVKWCSQFGASECEACIEDRIEKTVILQKDKIKSGREKHEITMGLRVFKGKRRAFTSTTLPEDVERKARGACTLVQHAEEDEAWESLPSPAPLPAVEGIYDSRLADMSLGELVEISILLASPFPEISIDSAKVTTFVTTCTLMNSHGTDCTYQSTKWHVFLSCLPRKGGASAAVDWAVSTQLDIPLDELAETTAKTVRDSLKAVPLKENFKGEVLFSENVCAHVFLNSLASAVNAENLRRDLSFFKGKTDQKVASENITLTDDGLLPKGVFSAPFDREGVPRQKTLLIERGVLRKVLHSEYTARLFKTHSTGNAVGSAMTEPVVGMTNLLLTPGTSSKEDMITHMRKGFYVCGFSGGTDVTTGDFSGVVPHGYYIERGEIQFPARALISGNSFSSLMNVHSRGREQKPNVEGMYAVPLLVDEVNVISC